MHKRLVVALAAIACSSEPKVADVPARMYSQGAYDSLPRLRLVATGTVCNADSLACTFDRGIRASVDDSGNVAFVPYSIRNPQVRLFPGGAGSVRLLGRQGSGPGEYQSVVAIGFTPTGTVRAFDALQYRVLEYARSGAVVATSTVPLPPGFITAGFVRGELRIVATDYGTRSGDSAGVAMFAADTGARRPRKIFELGVRQRSYAMGDMVPMKPPLEASPHFAIRENGGVLYSPGTPFAVDVIDPAGAHTDRFGIDIAPRKVTEADLEEWQRRAGRGLPSYMRAAVREGSSRPARYHAAITELLDVGGLIWVREAEQGDSAKWIAFESDQKPRGYVMLSSAATVLTGRGDALLVSDAASVRGRASLNWFLVSR